MDSPPQHPHTNRLIHEKSPYLLQHAHNPVDWHAWGSEAFEKARAEDKLVLLSIGYATCHWCHVMERESFEDEALAAYLNAHFVAIKVDREERPDVDKIYMDALQAMGQQGGWPLNMFITPDARPITGGTYFPPQPVQGRPAFRQILETLHGLWAERREELLTNAEALTTHLQERAQPGTAAPQAWGWEPVQAAMAQFRDSYDARHGGFTLQAQNKFPPSMGLSLMMKEASRQQDPKLLEMAEHTLKKMVAGGIYDQLGGGLSRYSTDHKWLVPHFEKMLYDNALFAQALTEAYLITGNELYKVYAEDVIDYVLRDMTAPEGGFFSAEDADSEGEEGLFYTWTPAELHGLLDARLAKAAMAYWGVTPGGNFEGGRSILHAPKTLAEVARALDWSEAELAEGLQQAREILFEAREGRIRPLRDDKILTSWNALMISTLAKAGRIFGNETMIRAAAKAAGFILKELRDDSGRLLRRYRDGEARFKAYLVDYAQLAVACLDLYEADYAPRWFGEATRLMEEVNRLFRNEQGAYFDTGLDAEPLLTRTMDGYDGVEPSGNSAAAQAFLRLRAHGGDAGCEADAHRILAHYSDYLGQAGVSFAAMLSALHFHLSEPLEIAVVGNPEHPVTQGMLSLVRHLTLASVTSYARPESVEEAGHIVPLLRGREAIEGQPTAYVCRNLTCQLPVQTLEALQSELGLT